MKIFAFVLGALAVLATAVSPAGAHPHSHAPVVHAPKWVQLDPESVISFNAGGDTFTLWNTHQRGLFGLELIEIHDDSGAAVAGWWSSRGWCFTAQAMETKACFSGDDQLSRFAGVKLANASYARPVTIRGTSYSPEASTEFCDHYTLLEAKISMDDSGNCDYDID